MTTLRHLLLDLLDREESGELVGALVVLEFHNGLADLTGFSPTNLEFIVERGKNLLDHALKLIPEGRVH